MKQFLQITFVLLFLNAIAVKAQTLNVKVFLQGFYTANGMMRSTL